MTFRHTCTSEECYEGFSIAYVACDKIDNLGHCHSDNEKNVLSKHINLKFEHTGIIGL